MSANTATLISNFVAAQTAYVTASFSAQDAESMRQLAFADSAMAACAARKGRVTLQKLADANKAATAELAETAPKGTLYVSLVSVTVHAIVGEILGLPVGEDDAEIVPTSLQSVVLKSYKGIGVKGITAALKGAKTQAGALDALKAANDAKVDAPVSDGGSVGGDDDSDGETFGGGTVTELPAQTVETLLSRVLAAIADGAELSDAATAMIGELSELAFSVAA